MAPFWSLLVLLYCITTVLSTFTHSSTGNNSYPKGKGFFIRLNPYSPQLHGPLPFNLDQQHIPYDLISPEVDIASLVQEQQLNELENVVVNTLLSRRTRVYLQRKQMTDFLASQVLQDFSVMEMAEVMWIEPLIYVPRGAINHLEMIQLTSHSHIMAVEDNDIVAQTFPSATIDDIMDELTVKDGYAWGLEKIGIHKAWEYNQGQNIRVGIIDTGVNYLHHSIKQNYAGFSSKTQSYDHDYAWFDPKEFRHDEWWCDEINPCVVRECCLEEPFDIIGHGTHVTSTIVGQAFSNGTADLHLGVAPGATWIAAKGCRDGMCLKYGLLKSAEWMSCPTRINGTDVNCDLGADVINNSWGSQKGKDDLYKNAVKVWREMGIIPVFAGGNNGPHCGSVSAPGDFLNVIGVAASDVNDRLAKFSSRGPGPKDEPDLYSFNKPDLTAPGSKVLSADYKKNDSAVLMSGTSMATPHITGVVTLLLSELRQQATYYNHADGQRVLGDKNDRDEYATVLNAMCQTAKKDMGEPIGWGGRSFPLPGLFPIRKQCEKSSPSIYPNLFYGCGRVQADEALKHLHNSK